MADFKKDFANHINVIGTNPYLFIGSGLSRRYLNMPTWLNLLKDFPRNYYSKKVLAIMIRKARVIFLN